MSEERKINADIVYEVVKGLIGNIRPVGCSCTDEINFENLKVMTKLTNMLLAEIDDIDQMYRNSHEFSVKRAAEHCADFLTRIGIVED